MKTYSFADGFNACYHIAYLLAVPEIGKLFERLTPHQRQVVALTCLLGQEYRYVAEALGITEETVSYHMRRATRSLGYVKTKEMREAIEGPARAVTSAVIQDQYRARLRKAFCAGGELLREYCEQSLE